jgi:SAM-dependent methyltransferase
MDTRVAAEVRKQWEIMLDCELGILEDAYERLGTERCRFVDLGCGSMGVLGRRPNRLAALEPLSIGIDIDREALTSNGNVRSAICASCYALPLKSNSVDIIVCRWILEHLEHPDLAMREMARVLRKDGVLYVKTPNLWNYTMLFSRITSTGVHNFVRSAAGAGDNIPTFYRANTNRKLRRLAEAHGFAVRRVDLVSYSFMYYSFNKEVFLAMRALSRLVSKVTLRMSQTLLGVFEKVKDNEPAISAGSVRNREVPRQTARLLEIPCGKGSARIGK